MADVTISGMASLVTPASGDLLAIVDISEPALADRNKKIAFSDLEGALNHDALTGFVGDEHVPHSSISITAGVGLSGGGTIDGNVSLAVDLNELTTETAIATGDFIAMVDITDNGSGKITFANFESSISHANLAGVVADEHVAHSSISITAGNGLSGGGTIDGNVSLAVDLNELGTETAIAAGDFIAMVDITDSGSQKITFANFEAALNIANLTNYSNVVLRDGSTALTASWDVGAQNINNIAAASIGVSTPNGVELHVRNSDVAEPSPLTSTIALFERDANMGITLMTGNTSIGRINFGDPQNEIVGGILYDHTIDEMTFRIGNSNHLKITGTLANFSALNLQTTGALTISGNSTFNGITNTFNGDIVMGAGDQIDFEDEVGDKLLLFGTTYGIGISSNETVIWTDNRVSFRTTSRTGTELAHFDSTGLDMNQNEVFDVSALSFVAVPTAADQLDYYEEGSWTPEIWDQSNNGSEGQTYSKQYGRYTRIGDVVFVEGHVVLTSIGSLAGANTVRLGNFPFAPDVASEGAFAVSDWNITSNGAAGENVTIENLGASYFNIREHDSATGPTTVSITDFGASGMLKFSGHYFI